MDAVGRGDLIPIQRLADLDAPTGRGYCAGRTARSTMCCPLVEEASLTPWPPAATPPCASTRRASTGRTLDDLAVSDAEFEAARSRRGPRAAARRCATAARNITRLPQQACGRRRPRLRRSRACALWRVWRPDRARRPVRARRQGGLPLVGADERDAGAHRRLSRDRRSARRRTGPGRSSPAILLAADLLGARQVFKLGGAQAIAAHGLRHGRGAAGVQAVRRGQSLGHGRQARGGKPGPGGDRPARRPDRADS